jgi:hypothetical protein
VAMDWRGYETLVGDVNGDGRADLIWNRLTGGQNQIYVGLSSGDGIFQLLPAQEISGDWGQYRPLLGHVD